MPKKKTPPAAVHANGVDETSNQKFLRLGTKRMGAFRQRVKSLRNLAAYVHTPEQRDKMLAEIKKQVADIEHAFDKSTKAPQEAFRFD